MFFKWNLPRSIRLKLQALFLYLREENQDYNNYQPISLISNLSKLMKKLLQPRFYRFFKKNSPRFEQYVFSKKVATDHALIDRTRKIQTACKNK